MHREPQSFREYPCPNGCDGGKVYETTHPEWFKKLTEAGAVIYEDAIAAGRTAGILAVVPSYRR